MTTNLAVIAGASGFVGGAVLDAFVQAGWHTVGLSRRRPAQPIAGVEYCEIDLLDETQCRHALASYRNATHLIYAAVNETPDNLVAGWSDPDHASRNGRMFANALDSMLAVAQGLEHVGIVHGTKAYGLGPAQHRVLPWREDLPRPPRDDFYFRQEDHVARRAAERGFHWTTYRPPMILGGGEGSNLNSFLALATLGCLLKEAGEAFPYPFADTPLGVHEMVDVRHLARAIRWGATAEGARNQSFNVANGDVFTWPYLFPVLADEIGVPIGPPKEYLASEVLSARASEWARITEKYGLSAAPDITTFLGTSAHAADFLFAIGSEVWLTNSVKLRQAGFLEFVDTPQSLREWIRQWRAWGLLPPR